jgi:hypothetical protein
MDAEIAYASAHTAAGDAASPHSRPERFRWGRQAGTQGGDPALRRAAGAVFAALVVATVGGLFLAQRIKHTPTSVQGFRLHPLSFSPQSRNGPTVEQLSFRVAKTGQVTVAIVGSSGDTVATLVRNLPWQRYLRLCLAWNGRRGAGGVLSGAAQRPAAGICPAEPAFALPAGRLAPAGDYRVRVSLRHSGHSVLSPSSFALVRAAGS